MDIHVLTKGAGAVVRLQITPEKSLVDTYLIGGEAFQRDIHRLLKHFRPDILLEEDGQPVYGRKIPSLQSGIYDGGQIQPVPVHRTLTACLTPSFSIRADVIGFIPFPVLIGIKSVKNVCCMRVLNSYCLFLFITEKCFLSYSPYGWAWRCIMRISHAEGPAETRPLSKYYYRIIPVFMQEIHILCSGGE